MSAPGENEVFCPRCRYNLRGLPEPRCPECGLTFSAEMWASGVLREHIPTWLDQCDPWQPHQVLIRSLYELIHGALRPRWVLTKLDLNGPLWPAVLMLIFGTVWLYVIITVFVAAATFIHEGVSPYASLKSGALYWAPRVLVVMVPTAVLDCAIIASRRRLQMDRISWHQHLRCAGYWIPTGAGYIVLPLILLVLVPELMLNIRQFWVLIPGFVTIEIALVTVLPRLRRIRDAVLAIALCSLVLIALFAIALPLARLVPYTLDPPWWVYF